MSTGDYILGVAGLAAIVVSLGVCAPAVRRTLLPDWSGAPALVADAVLGIGLYVLIAELLGLVGLLTGLALVIASAPAAIAITLAAGRAARAADGDRREGEIEPRGQRGRPGGTSAWIPSPETLVAAAIAFLVALQWAGPSLLALDRGIYGGDSLWYHLPFAAHFAQTGSVTGLLFTDPLYLNWFYPQNSELVHAGGLLLFGNDFLSPLINLAWLGLALLAAWCVGRPYGAGAPALAGVAALMSADIMFSRQPGNANNDVVAIALLLASVAVITNAAAHRGRVTPVGGPLVGGLAAGLAIGTKLTVVVPVLTLTAGVIAIAAAGTRLRTAGAWLGGLLAGGGLWYARNLIVSGNPFPWEDLWIFPKAGELEGRHPYSIAHYLTDTGVWGRWFEPGLHERLGDLWPLALAAAAAGVLIALIGGRRLERMLAVVAAVSAIAYLLTPLGAAGPEGMPFAFRLNIRYLAPALALAFVLLTIPPSFARGRERWWTWGALGLFALLILASNGTIGAIDGGRLGGSLLLAMAVVFVPVAAVACVRARVEVGAVVVVLVGLALILAIVGRGAQTHYLDERYSVAAPDYPVPPEHPATELDQGMGVAFDWARGLHDQRIALSGTLGALFQYGLWGKDSSNDVRVIGRRGDHGTFDAITDCPGWVRTVNDGNYSYLVTTPTYNQDHPERDQRPVESGWMARAPNAYLVVGSNLVAVWKLNGPISPAVCGNT
jgi:hypothetical protein